MTTADRYGLEKLAVNVTTSALSTVGPISFAPRSLLVVQVHCVGMSASFSDCQIQFNGDTGLNYSSQYDRMQNITGTTLSASFSSSGNSNAFSIFAGNTNTANGFIAEAWIGNLATNNKHGVVLTADRQNSVTTLMCPSFGGFSWYNATTQISSITFLTSSATTFSTGFAVRIFGSDF